MSDHAPMPAGDHSPRPPIMPFRRGACRSASASESVGSPGGDGGDEMARLLVREADHRIANSLQLVVAQLTRGRLGVMDPAAADLLDRALAQVTAIAEVQRVLSCGAGTGEVGLRRTLTAMAARLADLRPDTQVSVAAEDVPALQPRQLEVIAVITAELVMNALKHAFPVGRPGHVAVRCGVIAGDLVLTVSDDGLGRRSDVGGASASGGTGQEMMVRAHGHAGRDGEEPAGRRWRNYGAREHAVASVPKRAAPIGASATCLLRRQGPSGNAHAVLARPRRPSGPGLIFVRVADRPTMRRQGRRGGGGRRGSFGWKRARTARFLPKAKFAKPVAQ